MKTIYSIADDNKTLLAERSFSASLEKVWDAWTRSELLDMWWGPLPYKAVTQTFSFREGGEWRYFMKGPEGDKHYCLNTYITIDPQKEFTAEDAFCNEDGSVKNDMPVSHWVVRFEYENGVTTIYVATQYETEAGLQKVIEMGMKEGFNIGLNQLEALLTE